MTNQNEKLIGVQKKDIQFKADKTGEFGPHDGTALMVTERNLHIVMHSGYKFIMNTEKKISPLF